MVAETRSAKRAAAAASISTHSTSSNSLITCLSSFSSSTSTLVNTSDNTRDRKINRRNVRCSSPLIARSILNKSKQTEPTTISTLSQTNHTSLSISSAKQRSKSAVQTITQRSVTAQSSPKLKTSSSIMSSCSSPSSSVSSRSSSTSSTSSDDSVSSLDLSSLSLTSTTDRSKSSPSDQSTTVDSPITWCPCFIITSANTGTPDSPIYTYIKATAEHNHSPNPVAQKIIIFISKLKDLSSDPSSDPSVAKYNKLVAQMKFTREEMAKLPTFYSLRVTLWRAHSKDMGTFPKDITFSIPEQFKMTSDEEQFIVIDHIYGKEQKRIILFSSPEQFQLLCTTTQLFADGTFSVTPRPFKQTYTIQALHESGIGKFYFSI
ncbi:unnamed protein product [Rotaria sordida]|uniref:Uncharacterized protein n=1 Tax=Rotaria sordida TaxID=392033 RepID=A0A815QWS4_9BILA|nr:unnamed protein product [Rotaria sordida]CAF1403119.1 unnamed protein product [Rotaria sordida]CAF1467548.1 unnamed protein product [Rotaria sordida]CAF1618769.1 unnamed protein product [Rotaria sordida]CAF3582730.1 unnamed protein product [Rotaria sordida]